MTLPFRLHRRQFFTANREVSEALKKLDSKVDSLEKRFDGLEKRFAGLEREVDGLKSKWNAFRAEYRRSVLASYSCFSKQKSSKCKRFQCAHEATIAWSSIKALGGGVVSLVAGLAGTVKLQEAFDKAVLDRTSCCGC